MRLFLICLAFVYNLNVQNLAGQKSNYIPGEYIIHVSEDKDVEYFRSSSAISLRSNAENISSKQIMKKPLNLWLIKINPNILNENDFEEQLRKEKRFISVRPNRVITPRSTPNDPDFLKQWQYVNTGQSGGVEGADMAMDLAWDITTGGLTLSGDTIVVCIIDDGVNGNHEDMKENMWKNHLEIPGNGIDDDGNGYIDDYLGWNITDLVDNVYSGGGHGTPVAGIVGAKGNNAKGVSGVNWKVKILPVNYGSANEANALSSYAYAYKMRKLYNETNGEKGAYIVVTNASWGVDNVKAEEAPLWCALYDSLGSVGILNCGATANSNTDVDIKGDLPTSCTSEYLISVTNLNKSDVKVGNAGFGTKSIDIGAYGEGVYTVTRNQYGTFGGTSGATPHVAGLVALLYAAPCRIFDSIAHINPNKAALIAKDMIFHGTNPITSLQNITTTGGKLNAFRSIKNLTSLCENCSPPAGITVLPSDETIAVSWYSVSGNSRISVRYRKLGGSPWTEIQNISKGHVIQNLAHCTEYEIQLGSDCGLLPSQYSYSKFITTTGCCNAPSIDSIRFDDSSFSFSITSQNLANYKLQYNSGNNIWSDTIIFGNKFELDNINECTAYNFRVQSLCSKYMDTSAYSNDFFVSTSCAACTSNEYCKFGKKDASGEWISSFSIGTQENISGSEPLGYKNFAGVTVFNLAKDEKYPFKIKAGYGTSTYQDFFKIYIDLNQDGFWTKNEEVFITPIALETEVSDTFYIPNDSKLGLTKLRVIMSYEKFEGACDDLKYEYGEIEDYCINILQNLCKNDAKLITQNIDKTKILFKSSLIDLKLDSTEILIRKFGDTTWESLIGKDSIFAQDLEECSLYEYQFRKICNQSLSAFSEIDTFRTACKNNVADIIDEFAVFPNPTNDIISISVGPNKTVNKILLLNMNGQEIFITSKYVTSNIIQCDIKHTEQGVYILQIILDNGNKLNKKIIKTD